MFHTNSKVQQKCKLFYSIVKKIHNLHSTNISFGDLKLSNIFVTKSKGIIFLDFSKSKLFSNQKIISTHYSGTLNFMSPEKILRKPFDRKI